MSAQIIQLSGRSQVAEFWIDEAVASIGSSPECSVRIPDIDPEACILQYADGTYYLHNRSPNTVRLESQTVASGQAIVWEDGERLYVNRQVTLQLAANGGPESHRRQVDDEPETETPEAEDSGCTHRQLAATAACLAVAVVLALNTGSGQDQPGSSQAYETLIGSLLAESPTADKDAEMLLDNLQWARYHELRGDVDLAKQVYGEVRDVLIKRTRNASASLSGSREDVYRFVRDRIETLSQ